MTSGKYRYGTALREHLPEVLAARIPQGRHDCGDHEWYKSAESTWRCYHCELGITHEVPWGEREIAARRYEVR
jgi:ribosomal protein L37AE/L43A